MYVLEEKFIELKTYEKMPKGNGIVTNTISKWVKQTPNMVGQYIILKSCSKTERILFGPRLKTRFQVS